MKRTITLTLSLFLAVLVFSPIALAQHQQPILWEDYYDPLANPLAVPPVIGGIDWANAVNVNKNMVFSVGASQSAAGIPVFTTRAYNGTSTVAPNPQVKWTMTGGSGEALAVTSDASRAYAVGYANLSGATGAGTAFSVKAYNATTGAQLWAKDYTGDPVNGGTNMAWAAAVNGNRLFVAGVTENGKTPGTVTGQDFTLRAFNATTGGILWTVQETGAADGTECAYAVAATTDKVFVAGTMQDALGNQVFTIRAYNALSGLPLWWDNYQPDATIPAWNSAYSIAVLGTRVFVAGTTETAVTNRDFSVRAYTLTGAGLKAPIWFEDYDRGTVEAALPGGDDEAFALAAVGNNIYVVGYVANVWSGALPGMEDPDFAIRVYSAAGGALGAASPRWWDYIDSSLAGGGLNGTDVGYAVAVYGTRVYAGGSIESVFGDPDAYTIAYPISNLSYTPPLPPAPAVRAAFLWEDVYDGGAGGLDVVRSIAAYTTRIFTAGETENFEGNADFTTVGFAGP